MLIRLDLAQLLIAPRIELVKGIAPNLRRQLKLGDIVFPKMHAHGVSRRQPAAAAGRENVSLAAPNRELDHAAAEHSDAV